MKSQKPGNQKTRVYSGVRYALAIAVMTIVLAALVAAFVLLRPLLLAQLANGKPSLNDATSEIVIAGTIAPTEFAYGVDDRLNGDLDALPASAFARGQTITVGVSDAFGQINPLYGGGDADQDAISLIFEPLLRINADGKPEPVLAETIMPDLAKRTLTLQLRTDHIWRDGRVVDADDVVFTYRCLLSPSYDGPLAGRFDDIASVAAEMAADGRQTVVMTFRPGIANFDYSLLSVGILKSDYYAVAANQVYEIGRKRLPPEGSGAYQWLETRDTRRILGLRQGFAGEVLRIEQVLVGSDEKYPMLQSGALDIVRHDWSERIQSRVARLPGYAYFDAFRIDQYLLAAPNPAANGLPTDPAAVSALLRTATGLTSAPLATAGSKPFSLAYFTGLEETVSHQLTADAELIKRRLEQAGQPVTLQPLTWPDLADHASLGTFQLLLLPAATDNRLPRQTVMTPTRADHPVNAVVAFQHPQILLVSARLAGLKVNPNGALFAASPLTFTDQIASVRILDADGSALGESPTESAADD